MGGSVDQTFENKSVEATVDKSFRNHIEDSRFNETNTTKFDAVPVDPNARHRGREDYTDQSSVQNMHDYNAQQYYRQMGVDPNY